MIAFGVKDRATVTLSNNLAIYSGQLGLRSEYQKSYFRYLGGNKVCVIIQDFHLQNA
jgi:hypothetical protein